MFRITSGIIAIGILAVAALFFVSRQRSLQAIESRSGQPEENVFRQFAEKVLAAPVGDRVAHVDRFISSTEIPVVSTTTATFLYRGDATSVHVAGDFNGWNGSADSMQRLAGTDLWFYESEFEPAARIDYKLVVDGEDWILDPLNPATVPGGFGENSEMAMAGYIQPAEIVPVAGVSRGQMIDTTITSRILGNDRQLIVYLPDGYDHEQEYGMVLFHDGPEFLRLGYAAETLDNLISSAAIEPVIGVFVPPVERELEYATEKTDLFEQFIVSELLPFIDSTYSVTQDPGQRASAGASYGALVSAQLCFRNAEIFGLCGLFSTAFQARDGAVMQEMMRGDTRPVRMYLDWGTYEPGIARMGREFSTRMKQKGYDVEAREWPEGHSWGSWRAHVDDMLLYLFANPKT